MKKVKVVSSDRMSNTKYHRNGKPNWWVRIGSGDSGSFLRINEVRGDSILRVTVSVPDDCEELFIGCGPRGAGVRETIDVDDNLVEVAPVVQAPAVDIFDPCQ